MAAASAVKVLQSGGEAGRAACRMLRQIEARDCTGACAAVLRTLLAACFCGKAASKYEGLLVGDGLRGAVW